MAAASVPTRPLGRSGLMVSVIGLGLNNLGRAGTVTETQAGTDALIDAALDAGITFLDVADSYGAEPGLSERMLGAALAGRRDGVVLSTKFGMPTGLYGDDFGARGSRRYIKRAVEGSLTRLNTDRIDLYHYHEPDGVTPIEETLTALDELVAEGKVLYLASSNQPGWLIAKADATAERLGTARFLSTQSEYSLLARKIEHEVLPSARAHGLGVIPYFPLFNGLLTGKYADGRGPAGTRLVDLKPQLLDAADWDQLARFSAWCRAHDVREIEVAFGWLLAQPGVASVIAGATRPEQVRENAGLTRWVPSAAELAELDEIFPPVTPAGGFANR